MRKVILYIAMSLDGCIADEEGSVDWLNRAEYSSEHVSSYDTFIQDVDTVIMGWNTYHQVVTELSPDQWVYKGLRCYVLTHRKPEDTEDVTFTDMPVCDLVNRLRYEEGKNIWICGGADVAGALMHADLIDRYQITTVPVILGSGIRLFPELPGEMTLRLISAKTYGGYAELVYDRSEEWHVYYEENFWSGDPGKRPGREIRIDRDLEWEGDEFRLLSFYVCEEGYVLDLCRKVRREAYAAFQEKWRDKTAHPEEMTETELEQCETENPMNTDFGIRLETDGVRLETGALYAMGSAPDYPEYLQKEAERFISHYGLDPKEYWMMARFSFSRPAGAGEITCPDSLKFMFEAVPVPVSAISFEIEGPGQKISFVHPETGEEHVMEICSCEQRTMPEEFPEMPEKEGGIWKDWKIPRCYEAVSYTLSPDIPEETYMVRSRSEGDKAVPVERKKEVTAEMKEDICVQIIGGADGPTSVFLAGKVRREEKDDKNVHRAISAVSFEPVRTREWELVFWLKKKQDMELPVILAEGAEAEEKQE